MHDDFQWIKTFCEGIPVVNDLSEKSVQLMSDFINNVHSEDDRQDLILAMSQYQAIMKGKSTKTDIAEAYADKLF